jgi:hypothetical protein
MDQADNWIAEPTCYKPKLTSIPHWGTLPNTLGRPVSVIEHESR